MAVLAKTIIKRATDLLQDSSSITWAANELVRWLNDGQREIVVYRPDACTAEGSLALVAGARQALPSTAHKLIDILCNTGGTKGAVTFVTRSELDDLNPYWRGMTGATEIAHFCYDQRQPRAFDVYPPAAVGAAVDAVYAVYPTDVAEPADGSTWADVAGNIGVADLFSNALLDYVLYRAYLKDDSDAGNAARSVGHYTAFKSALGGESQATQVVTPKAGAAA